MARAKGSTPKANLIRTTRFFDGFVSGNLPSERASAALILHPSLTRGLVCCSLEFDLGGFLAPNRAHELYAVLEIYVAPRQTHPIPSSGRSIPTITAYICAILYLILPPLFFRLELQ